MQRQALALLFTVLFTLTGCAFAHTDGRFGDTAMAAGEGSLGYVCEGAADTPMQIVSVPSELAMSGLDAATMRELRYAQLPVGTRCTVARGADVNQLAANIVKYLIWSNAFEVMGDVVGTAADLGTQVLDNDAAKDAAAAALESQKLSESAAGAAAP
jgi:hypothetical protein